MPPGGYNSIPNEDLYLQIKNINKILKCHDNKLNYGIISGEIQVVAGYNYKMYIIYNNEYYLVSYYVSLDNKVTGNLFSTAPIEGPIICYIDYKIIHDKCKKDKYNYTYKIHYKF